MTVVIPVWDHPYVDTLPRALASVRAQAEEALIVVVDNLSDPAIQGIPGATVIRTPRRLSKGATRNIGLESVATEYVVLLDADDELAEGALPTLREGIGADPGVAVYSMALLEAETGARHRNPRRLAVPLTRVPRLFALATALWSLYPIQGAAVMRTRSVRESGGYADCDDGEDWVLAVSQAFRGRVILDPRPGLIYHRSPSAPRSGGGHRGLLAATKRVRARLRADSAVPRWARAALPVIATAQTILILLIRPGYRALRAARRRGPARRHRVDPARGIA